MMVIFLLVVIVKKGGRRFKETIPVCNDRRVYLPIHAGVNKTANANDCSL
ncbi:unnamed protein product [Brassica rapa subsp. trilocularis]